MSLKKESKPEVFFGSKSTFHILLIFAIQPFILFLSLFITMLRSITVNKELSRFVIKIKLEMGGMKSIWA